MTTTATPRGPRPTPRAGASRPGSSRSGSSRSGSSVRPADRGDAPATRSRGASSRSAAARALRPREQAARRPDLAVADAPSGRSIRVMGIVAFLFVFGALFGLAAFHSVLVQNQLRIDRLAKEVTAEEALHEQLRLAYARQSSPDRMLAEAQAREMVQPTEPEYLSAVVPGADVVPRPQPNPYNTRRTPSTTAAPATTTPGAASSSATSAGAASASTTVASATTRAPATSVTPTTARPSATTARPATTRAVG